MYHIFSIKTSLFHILFFISVVFYNINAQSNNDQFINASIGLGVSIADDESDVIDQGFYIQGEYVYVVSKWIDVRPYLGFITTQKDDDEIENPENHEASITALLVGGKSRVTIPIPYIAPYFEIGVGVSVGSYKTFTEFTNIEESGLQMHIPFSIGLELGKKHNIDLAFSYYFHNNIDQTSGAAAIGLSFPLDKN